MVLRKILVLVLSIALIISGVVLMIGFEHPLPEVWANPSLIFWDHSPHEARGGRLWFIGPFLIFAGTAIIAEDWFGFGQQSPEDCSADSGSQDGTRQDAQAYERDRLEQPPSSISRS